MVGWSLSLPFLSSFCYPSISSLSLLLCPRSPSLPPCLLWFIFLLYSLPIYIRILHPSLSLFSPCIPFAYPTIHILTLSACSPRLSFSFSSFPHNIPTITNTTHVYPLSTTPHSSLFLNLSTSHFHHFFSLTTSPPFLPRPHPHHTSYSPHISTFPQQLPLMEVHETGSEGFFFLFFNFV